MNRSLLSALALLALLALWMVSGRWGSAPVVKKTETAQLSPMKVKTRISQAQPMERLVQVKGQVEPFRQVTLRAETLGRVEELPVDKGMRVAEHGVLARLSANDRNARLAESQAMVNQHRQNLDAVKALYSRKLSSESRLKEEEANLAVARASLERIRWEIENTIIRAPFAGVLDQRMVELGSFLQVGDPLGVLVDDSTLLLTAQAPQMAVKELRLGQKVQAVLAQGQTLEAELSYVSEVAEPQTRSYRMEARVLHAPKGVLSGLSVTLTLSLGEMLAHKVRSSTLGLDVEGRLMVKAVEADGTVGIHPVTLLRRERDGMWVSGLPETLQLILMGQEYLNAGDKVLAVPEDQG